MQSTQHAVPKDRNNNRPLGAAGLIGGILLAVYIATYCLTVRDGVLWFDSMDGNAMVFRAPVSYFVPRFCEPLAARVFTPRHRLDRQFRPHIWESRVEKQ